MLNKFTAKMCDVMYKLADTIIKSKNKTINQIIQGIR